MKQLTITGFAHCKPAHECQAVDSNYRDGFAFGFSPVALNDGGFIGAGKATMTIELPDNFDPRVGAVETLKARKLQAMSDFQKLITQIDQQISQYTAIECAL